jgi:PAS domain S-box-containing protein
LKAKKIKKENKERAAGISKPYRAPKEKITVRKRAEAELASSLSLLRATLESTADGILVVDRDGKIVSLNRKFISMWSMPDSIIESRDDSKAVEFALNQLKDPGAFLTRVKDLYLQPHMESYDVLEFKDGRIFERYSQPQRIGESIVGRVWSFRDVTDRKRAEKSLEEREKRLRKQNKVLLDLAGSRALEQGDLDSALREIAEAAARTLGTERANIWLYNHSRSKVQCVEQYELSTGVHSKGYELAAADYPLYFRALEEERIIAAHDAHTDPRTREFSDTYLVPYGISSLLDAPIRVGGRMVGLICHENVGPARRWNLEEQHFAGSMADFISLALEAWERKRAEQALRDSEERFRTLIEHSYDLIFEASVDGKFLYLSPNHEDVLGYEPSELMGKDIFENIHPDDRAYVIAEFTRIMGEFSSGHATFRLRDKNGEWRWLESAGKPFRNVAGEIRAVIASRDITERKSAEDALKESLAQLSKKNRYETIISTVTCCVHQSLNLQNVLENAVDAMSKNIEGAQNIGIWLVEENEAVIRAFRGFPDWFVKEVSRIPYPKGATWKTIIEGKPTYSPDTEKDKILGSAGIKLGTKTYLSMPIHFGTSTVGVININSFEKNAFDEEELKLLEIVSQQIEAAISNAKQAEALRQSEDALRESLAQLSKKNRYETIISTVIRSVHQSTNLQDVIDNAVQAIIENIDRADNVAIYLVEGEEAVLKVHRGYSDWYIERVGRIPYPIGYAWKVIMDEKPRYCADVDEDTVIGPAGREFGIKSYLSMPIQFEGKTIGVININSFEKDAFDEGELKLLEIVREQITVALGNTRQKGALQEALSEVETLKKRLQAENLYFHGDAKAEHSFEDIIGRSSLLRKVLLKVEQVATTDSAVLIWGETGTGKELMARAIHKISTRKDRAFVKVNFSEFPKNQIEGELFGREEKGNFSGVLSLSIGRFELANGGTIFLDEILGVPLEIQSKLLRVLQEGEFKRQGSSHTVKVDIRVIAATSHDLEQALRDGHLMEELHNELDVFQIKIPPLRERKEDIPLLVKHFITKHSSRIGKNIQMLPQSVMDTLIAYNWPGNVRELEGIIEKAIVSTDSSDLDLDEKLGLH